MNIKIRLFTCSYLCTLVRCDWCISILIIRITDDVPSRVRFVVERLLCFLIVGIHASGILTRRVKEAIQIRLHSNNINRDNGIEIPEAWMPTIRKHNSGSTTKRTREGTSSVIRNNKDRNTPITANQRA